MMPNSRQLAMRDPALAALMGLGPGAESNFGAEFGSEFGAEFGAEFGDDEYSDYGAEIPISALKGMGAPTPSLASLADSRHPASPMHPANQGAMIALWQHHMQKGNATHRRMMLLDPNRDSTVKVEGYSFNLSAALVIGTASAINTSDSPATRIRATRIIMNAPAPGFVTISEIKISNVSVTSGAAEDAFGYNPVTTEGRMNLPTLTPSNKATVQGNSTTFVPASYVVGAAFSFTVSFRGPANLAGDAGF